MRRTVAWTLTLLILAALPALAQAPAPTPAPACEGLEETQIQLQAVTVSQLRERGEAARELAALRRQTRKLETDLAAVRKQLEAAATKKEAPK